MVIATIIVIAIVICFGLRSWNKRRDGDRSYDKGYDNGYADGYNDDDSYSDRDYSESILNGEDFEIQVERKLAKLKQAGARLIRDCYLRWNNGATTQIDIILIFRSGIYVIECKDYSGWIFANCSHDYWTQTLPYGWQGDSTKNRFYNPIKQNQNHIKCIRQKLGKYSTVPMHNIIVFSDYCEFKKIENDSSAWIVKVEDLYRIIWQIEQETEPRLTEDDIEWISLKLTSDEVSGDSVVAEHVLNVNRIKQQKVREQYSTGNTCPRCGAPLVLRDGQYGRFYGCMRYPTCKYTRKQQ